MILSIFTDYDTVNNCRDYKCERVDTNKISIQYDYIEDVNYIRKGLSPCIFDDNNVTRINIKSISVDSSDYMTVEYEEEA